MTKSKRTRKEAKTDRETREIEQRWEEYGDRQYSEQFLFESESEERNRSPEDWARVYLGSKEMGFENAKARKP